MIRPNWTTLLNTVQYEVGDRSIILMRLMKWRKAWSTNSSVSCQLNTKSKDYSRNLSFFLAFSGKRAWLRESPVCGLAVISPQRLINDYSLPTVKLPQLLPTPRFGCQQWAHTNATTHFTETLWRNSQADYGCCFRAPSCRRPIDSLLVLFPQVIHSFNRIVVSKL